MGKHAPMAPPPPSDVNQVCCVVAGGGSILCSVFIIFAIWQREVGVSPAEFLEKFSLSSEKERTPQDSSPFPPL